MYVDSFEEIIRVPFFNQRVSGLKTDSDLETWQGSMPFCWADCPQPPNHPSLISFDSKSITLGGDPSIDILHLRTLFFFFLFWLRWVFVAARGLSLVAVSGAYSSF